MIHPIKVTLYLEVDTDVEDFEGPTDIDSIIEELRTNFQPIVLGDDTSAIRVQHVQVEIVE